MDTRLLEICTVDLTPRRVQRFQPEPGSQVRWTNRSLAAASDAFSGTVVVDKLGLVTLPAVRIGKGKNRIILSR